MKRILSILLVSIAASVASATTVTLVPIEEGDPGSSTNPLQPSDTVTLLVATDYPLIALDVILTVTSGGIITGAVNTGDCVNYGWDAGLAFDPLGIGTTAVEIGLGHFMGNMNTIVGYFDIRCTGQGNVVIELSNASTFGSLTKDIDLRVATVEGSLTIYQVPEPATIALLGLGGLLLVRRRK